METLETREGSRLRLVVDEYPANPRGEFEQLTNVVTVPSREYADIDADGGPLADGWVYFMQRHNDSDAVELFERWARVFHGAVTLYDTPYRGPNSVWYLTADDQREVPDPMACIRGERDEYRAWAEGDVYGYVIEREVTWRRTDVPSVEMTTWELGDSCYGFYGYEYAVEAAREAWADWTWEPGENAA